MVMGCGASCRYPTPIYLEGVPLPYHPHAPHPHRSPFHREGWVYEEKYDGWRILALKADGKVQLLSRNGRDHAQRFGELARVIGSLPETTLILDGEVAMFDEHLISRFEWLRHGARESLSTPPIYMAFDVRQVGHQDLGGNLYGHGGRCWRVSWMVNASSYLLGGSQGVAWRRGGKWWREAMRASWRRMNPPSTSAGGRSPGSR